MENEAAAFSFPTLARLSELSGARSSGEISPADAAVNEAIERGYASGFSQGRADAEAAAVEAAKAARAEGLAQGRAEGLDEIKRAGAALGAAAEQLEAERAALAAGAEAFCVEVALAIVARLVEADAVRAEFVGRAARLALKALAPEAATAIFLNPADRAIAGPQLKGLPLKDDETLAPGHVRVEAGRLLVEGAIDKAFDEIRSAVIDVKSRRTRAAAASRAPAPASKPIKPDQGRAK
jgi:flagellar assembly protein FliH